MILHKLREDAARAAEAPPERAVITCPAIFDGAQGSAVSSAAALAGFAEAELLEEPVAAAIAFEHEGGQLGNGVLVYDYGGGTFDAAFVFREEGEQGFGLALEPAGDARLGGDDLDQALYDHFNEQVRRDHGRSISGREGVTEMSFLRACRRRKEMLSKSRHATFSTTLEPGVTFTAGIDRAEFEDLIRPQVERTVRITADLVDTARSHGYVVDTLLLVGGSSQLPLVQRLLRETLDIDPQLWGHRDVAVALGAAYRSETLWGRSRQRAPLSPEERYRRSVETAWSDKRLTAGEAERLTTVQHELGLTDLEAAEIEVAALGRTKEEFLAAAPPDKPAELPQEQDDTRLKSKAESYWRAAVQLGEQKSRRAAERLGEMIAQAHRDAENAEKSNLALFDQLAEDFDNGLGSQQRRALRRRIVDGERLVGLCRCALADAERRDVALLLTTQKAVWARAKTAALEVVTAGSVRWSDVTDVRRTGSRGELVLVTNAGRELVFRQFTGQGLAFEHPSDDEIDDFEFVHSDLARIADVLRRRADNPFSGVWTAEEIEVDKSMRGIRLDLEHNSRVVEYRAAFTKDTLIVDGELVHQPRVPQGEYEIELRDGSVQRRGIVGVTNGAMGGLKRLYIEVDGRVIYDR